MRLAKTLADQGYLPVITNAEDRVALHAAIDLPSVLMPLLYETEVQVLAVEGGDLADSMHESVVRRFWNWLNHTDVELSRFEGASSTAGTGTARRACDSWPTSRTTSRSASASRRPSRRT